MKKILLATAVAAALLLAPVVASAQYAQPTAPITTPAPAPSTTSDDATAMQPSTTETAPAAPTTVTGQSSVTSTPSTTAQSSTYGAQSYAAPSASAQTQTYGSATAETAQTPSPSVTAQSSAPAYGATAMPAVASSSTQVRGQLISDAKALELAQDAGMQAVPMSAGAVCQPRSLDLTGGATHDNRNALEFAVDRASVCDLQEIELPSRGAASFRQALINQGVDASKIVEGDSGSTEARMTFAGVATSGGQYAAIFNPTRTAANTTTQSMSYAPAQTPSATDAAPSYAPSQAPSGVAPSATPSAEPSTSAPDHSSMDHSTMDDMSQPNETAPASPTL